MSRPISVPASLEGISPRKDGSMGFRFVTMREIVDPEEMATIMGYYNKEGYMLFAPQELQEADIPRDVLPTDEKKTPAQRLHGVLWHLWKQQGEQGSSEEFYRKSMEKIIDQVKAKLN